MHNETFQFEADFVASLRCVPMAVRMKLDACGVKLSLRGWAKLDPRAKRELLDTPCEGAAGCEAYRRRLRAAADPAQIAPLPPAAESPAEVAPSPREVPEQVRRFAERLGLAPIAPHQWAALSDLQRFALVKLSRDNHDNVNFVPALREFGLLS